jgi:hypothetical protein
MTIAGRAAETAATAAGLAIPKATLKLPARVAIPAAIGTTTITAAVIAVAKAAMVVGSEIPGAIPKPLAKGGKAAGLAAEVPKAAMIVMTSATAAIAATDAVGTAIRGVIPKRLEKAGSIGIRREVLRPAEEMTTTMIAAAADREVAAAAMAAGLAIRADIPKLPAEAGKTARP